MIDLIEACEPVPEPFVGQKRIGASVSDLVIGAKGEEIDQRNRESRPEKSVVR
jgi:hypothetical protein